MRGKAVIAAFHYDHYEENPDVDGERSSHFCR